MRLHVFNFGLYHIFLPCTDGILTHCSCTHVDLVFTRIWLIHSSYIYIREVVDSTILWMLLFRVRHLSMCHTTLYDHFPLPSYVTFRLVWSLCKWDKSWVMKTWTRVHTYVPTYLASLVSRVKELCNNDIASLVMVVISGRSIEYIHIIPLGPNTLWSFVELGQASLWTPSKVKLMVQLKVYVCTYVRMFARKSVFVYREVTINARDHNTYLYAHQFADRAVWKHLFRRRLLTEATNASISSLVGCCCGGCGWAHPQLKTRRKNRRSNHQTFMMTAWSSIFLSVSQQSLPIHYWLTYVSPHKLHWVFCYLYNNIVYRTQKIECYRQRTMSPTQKDSNYTGL